MRADREVYQRKSIRKHKATAKRRECFLLDTRSRDYSGKFIPWNCGNFPIPSARSPSPNSRSVHLALSPVPFQRFSLCIFPVIRSGIVNVTNEAGRFSIIGEPTDKFHGIRPQMRFLTLPPSSEIPPRIYFPRVCSAVGIPGKSCRKINISRYAREFRHGDTITPE